MQKILTENEERYEKLQKDMDNDLKNLKENDNYKKKKLVYLSFLASLFIAFSGFIFLYISLVDNDLDVEIAFN